LLVLTSVFLVDDKVLIFDISVSGDVKDLVVLDVDEVAVNILEHLEPSAVGRPDLQVS
jgi:hypothetical protein